MIIVVVVLNDNENGKMLGPHGLLCVFVVVVLNDNENGKMLGPHGLLCVCIGGYPFL